MKRILHVLRSLERSGMEMMLLSSAEEWHRQGYVCDVLATGRDIGYIAGDFRERGYGVFHLPFRGGLRYLPRFRFLVEFYRLCRSGYDVIHIHTEAGPPLFATIAKLARVPCIAVTPHNVFRFHGALRWRKWVERKFVRLLGAKYGMISEGVKRCEWETFRNRGVRIWNWLDTDHFRPPNADERRDARRTLNVDDEEFVIVSVGNCNKAKNHSALIKAVSLLPGSINPVYYHVGREHPEFPERSLAAELGIESKARFAGSVQDPLPFLWAADAYAMPSLNEGFPISAIEAVASGVILVCSDRGGLSDVASETQSTILTSIEPESIAEGLAKVGEWRHAERQTRGAVDSALICQRHSIEAGVRSLVEGLYR